jgi:hypothetical protein
MKTALSLALAFTPLCAQVTLTQRGNEKVSVEVDGKQFTDFWIGPETRKPYLHPLRTASGIAVTRGYPITSDIPGEAHDHPHHRGLWFTHGNVNGFNFWATEDGQSTPELPSGKVVLRKVEKLSNGKKAGAIEATFDWKTPAGETLLRESRKMTFYSDPNLRTIDFDVTLSPETIVTFGDTKEGMFAIRLAAGMEEAQPKGIAEPKRTGKLVNAQGKTGEKNVWGKRSEWADYSGQVDGQLVGVAILDHPTNPRFPTYWHARDYGLFAANIFGVHDFENDKSRDGSLTIKPGQPLRFRFRVVIHPGNAAAAGIREIYQQFSAVK